ncbi:MAG: hypothetical protein JXA20_00305 [Spirochaetes bacterium]|nr:hypothetical protein [Spirochaetota bacterium]
MQSAVKTAALWACALCLLYCPPAARGEEAHDIDRGNFGIFQSGELEDEVFGWYYHEHNGYGTQKHIESARRMRYENTVVMQRSGEKRLYDQNILLASLFRGQVLHRELGNMRDLLKGAVFIDIGSGILCGRGAPTVRDIFEDDRLWTNLSFIIATDINGPHSRYIDSYRIHRRDLPFPVRMVGMKMIWRRHFYTLTRGLLGAGTPLILRSANAGPDLYYPPHYLIEHFRAILREYRERNVLYLYNKFVLFKPAEESCFQKIGEIDSSVGMSHRSRTWNKVDWEKRRLEDFFTPNEGIITVQRGVTGSSGRN